MVRWLRWHCPPDTGFEIRALAVWGRARYLSVKEAPHNTNFHTWMGKKQVCFFQTAETGNRTPDSGVKGSWDRETTKVRNNERAKVRNNESAKQRKSKSAKQRKYETAKERCETTTKERCETTTLVTTKQRNNERAMRNCKRAKRNNETAKQRHCETMKGRCETAKLRQYERTKGRNCERAMRKSEILNRF